MPHDDTGDLSDPEILRKAAIHLSSVDERMSRIISKLGNLNFKLSHDLFFSLIESVISQQLSPKAADSIIERFVSLFPGKKVTPGRLNVLSDDMIRSCGVSRQKISYIKNLAEAISEGFLNLNQLRLLNDDEVVERLTRIKGVGTWTAKMILIFTLGRTDILPLEDVGVINAMQRVYVLDEKHAREAYERISDPWHPYCSVASLYLWKLRDDLPWEKEY